MKIAVIGAGNGGQAIAGYLATQGYEVALYDIVEEKINELRKKWEAEEKIVHIHGWDFPHIHDRYEEEDDFSWFLLVS